MPSLRASVLTTGELAVFDAECGDLVMLPSSSIANWEGSDKSIETAKAIAESHGGYVVSKMKLKSLLLATDRVVILT